MSIMLKTLALFMTRNLIFVHCFGQQDLFKVPVDPLIPLSDWHLISPYNINLESNIKVTRINEMIPNLEA